MNKTLKIAAAVLTLSAVTGMANAATPGAYAGLGLGVGHVNEPKLSVVGATSTSQNQNGLTGRVFGGYNFNESFGVEAGYNHYASASTKASGPSFSAKREDAMQSLDVVGKGYLPLGESSFNVYGLVGGAYVHDKVTVVASKTTNKVRPVVGLGAGYNIPQTNLVTSLEFRHTQGTGNVKTSASAIPNVDALTLNVAYNFG